MKLSTRPNKISRPADKGKRCNEIRADIYGDKEPITLLSRIATADLLDASPALRNNDNTNKRNTYDWPRQCLLLMNEVLTDFKSHLIRRGVFPMTQRKYLKDMWQFFKEKAVGDVGAINRESINDWVLTLRNRGLKTGTIANHLWAIKAFLKFLKEDKGISFYEFDIPIPAVRSPDKIEYLELDELEILYSVISISKLQGFRLRTLVEVMVNTGLRPTETLSLKRDDIKADTDELDIVGKGGKRRRIYFTENVRNWVRAYVAERKDDHPLLFVTHNGSKAKPLSLRNAEYGFQEAWKRTGIDKRVTLHTLRHTCATLLMANGCPPDYIAVVLGHSKVETTRKYYAAVRERHAKAAFFRFHPFHRAGGYEIGTRATLQLPGDLN